MAALHDRIKAALVHAYTHGRATESTVNDIVLLFRDALAEEYQRSFLSEKWPVTLLEREAAVQKMMEALFNRKHPAAGSDTPAKSGEIV